MALRTSGRTYRTIIWSVRLALLFGFVGMWQRVGTSSRYWEILISSPTRVLSELREWIATSEFWSDLVTTLSEAVAGYALGLFLAVVAVAIVVPFPVIDRFTRPFFTLLNALPKIVLAPLFLVWFGISLKSKVFFVTSVIFFIMFYGLYNGLKSIDRTLLDNTRALGATTLDLIRSVYARAILSWVISSLRIAWGFSLLAAVFSEFLGATKGIGQRIGIAQQMLQNTQVITGILVIAIVAVVFDVALVRVEKRFSKWRVF